jgi:dTDP-4-dehydrorhamnose reductase
MIRDLAHGQPPAHPVLTVPGWWRRDERLIHSNGRARGRESNGDDVPRAACLPVSCTGGPGAGGKRPLILIVGSTGTLGQAFARICGDRGLPHVLVGRAEMDIADPRSVASTLERVRPWAVINAAGFVRVDDAEQQRDRCFRENVTGAVNLARSCAGLDIRLVSFSSDLVFDGRKKSPYFESDLPAPLGVYGESKREAEAAVLSHLPGALVVRTSSFFGPWDAYNFVTVALHQLRENRSLKAADDVFVSPTYVPDLVHATLDLLIDGEQGRWHLANRGAVSWAELARKAAELASLDPDLVRPCSIRTLRLYARRPPFSALGSERALLMPPLEDALPRYIRDVQSPQKNCSPGLNLFHDSQ